MSRYQTVKAYIHRWIRAAGVFMSRCMEPGVLATIAVAVLAFSIQTEIADQEITIQKEIANQEMQRAAVSRSVALYRDFVGSEAVRKLRIVQHEMEHLIWLDNAKIKEKNKNKREKEKEKTSISVYEKKEIKKKKSEIRKFLVGVLQRIKLIYTCGNFRETYEDITEDQKTGESLCDKSTISTLLGGIFLELFYAFRPVMYCDPFFYDRYYQEGDSSGYIGMLESLVMEHLRNDMAFKLLGKSYEIFRTEAERKKAIEDLKIGKKDLNYSVLRSTLEKCPLYSK